MRIENVDFGDFPEKITSDAFDCVWVILSRRDRPRPLLSSALQWIDWKLLGQISKVILGEQIKAQQTIFIPVMNKLRSPFVALDLWEDWNSKMFVANCKGLKFKRVLCFPEVAQTGIELSGRIAEVAGSQFSTELIIGSDAQTRGSEVE